MPIDTLIKNGQIVSPDGIRSESIGIDKGKIVALGIETHLPDAKKEIDAGGNYVLPGIIDIHVHVGLFHPLEEEVKDTAGAIFAGTTTVVGLGEQNMACPRRFISDGVITPVEHRAAGEAVVVCVIAPPHGYRCVPVEGHCVEQARQVRVHCARMERSR